MRKLFVLVLWVILFGQFSGWSQTYPVTVRAQVVPPVPIYLSSYADAMTLGSPLRVQLLLNDFRVPQRQIRLKVIVQGSGFYMENHEAVGGAPPLFLQSGVPLELTKSELAPYFNLYNVRGISPTAYGKALPEGAYQFCFEVYDALSGKQLSGRSCAQTYIFQNEPPLLVFPANKSDVKEQTPSNIVFQWTPRHINVSNVEYELSLVEVWDRYANPQAVFLSSPPVFQTTTRSTNYVYGAFDPLLLPNKTYAWRVQAKAISGGEEIGMFKNQGYSEIFWFNHTSPCETPKKVRHEIKGNHIVNIHWEDLSYKIIDFVVRYRVAGSKGEWFYNHSFADWTTLWDLSPGTTYEYQVGRNCEVTTSEYSRLQTFTTPLEDDGQGLYSCGVLPDATITNMNPLKTLLEGETFMAADFPVKVLDVHSTIEGRYTGEGYISIPYLKNIKVAVEFTNVAINSDKQLTQGFVFTKYDPKWSNLVDIDQAVQDVGVVADIVQDLTGLLRDLFHKREEKLLTLQELQHALKNGTITTEEFTTKADALVVDIKALDDELNGAVTQGILNSPYATDQEKEEAKALEQSKGLVDTQTDVDKALKNQKAIDSRLGEIAASIQERTQAEEEEEFYDDKEYISKVFQQVRCRWAAKTKTLEAGYFDKTGQEFTATLEPYGTLNVRLPNKATRLGPVAYTSDKASEGTGSKVAHYELLTLDYGGLVIAAKWYNEGSQTKAQLEKLQQYLFPNDPNAVQRDYQKVLAQILDKKTLTNDDIKAIKQIANCGAQFFTVTDKVELIKKIADHSFALTEYYEDLILDLLENYDGDLTVYSNELLDELNKNPQLLQKLFYGIDNTGAQTLWKGNEANFDRFLKILYGLWQGSKYAASENYTYVEEQDFLDSGDLTPRVITYDGKSWFPEVRYEPGSFNKEGVKIATKTKYGRYGNLVFKYFQPVWMVFENHGKGKITKTQVPAIYFAGVADKDNLQKSLDQIGLTIDVALNFSAIGAVTKLKHLTRLQQMGRITLAGVEVTSATADILIRYSDLCEGNEAFCEAFQEYNTYLQLGLLGSGLLKAKFTASRAKAQEAYETQRDVLIHKLGAEDPVIKELDGHFGVGKNADINSLITRWDDLSSEEVRQLFNSISKSEIKTTKSKQWGAATANQNFKLEFITDHIDFENYIPPYKKGSFVEEITLSDDAFFVRLHYGKNEVGRWMMRIEDYKQLLNDPAKFKNVYALPSLPKEASLVKVPQGVIIWKGEVAGNKWGAGGGIQVQIENFNKIEDAEDWFQILEKL